MHENATSPAWKTEPSRRRTTTALIFLCLCAILGNALTPLLFLEFRYHWGSIATLIILKLFGVRWSITAAVLSTIPLTIQWQSPSPLFWIPLEPLFIAIVNSRTRIRNLLVTETFYWPLVAAPVMTVANGPPYGGTFLDAASLILMEWSIGMTNALLASLIMENMPIRRWLSLGGESEPSPVHSIFFNLLMAFILLPSFVIMTVGGREAVREKDERVQMMLSRHADSIRSEVRFMIGRYRSALDQLVEVAEKSTSLRDDGEFTSTTIAICREIPEIILVHAYDEKRSLIFPAANESLHRFRQTHSHLLNLALSSDHLAVDDRLHLIDDRFNVFSLAKRFLNADGSLGIIVIDINPAPLTELLRRSTIDTPLEAVLLDAEKRVIASNTHERSIGSPLPLARGISIEQLGTTTHRELNFPRGHEETSSPLFVRTGSIGAGIPWEFSLATPANPIQRELMGQHVRNLSAMVGLCILSLVVSLLLSARLTEPLRRLSLISGTIILSLPRTEKVEWPRSSVLEIDNLIGNFRKLSETLAEKFEELATVNHTLEERVEERTRELTEANAFLSLEIRDRIRAEEERDRTLAALESQLAFQNTLLEAIPNPIFFKDRHGRYLGCNRHFLTLIGRTKDEVIGKTVEEIYPPDKAAIYRAADDELFSRGGVQQYESVIGSPDDVRNVIFFKATYGTADEPVTGLVGVILDITDRKRVETQLENLTQELTNTNRELEGIVYAASHDLRSPLINIQGFSRKLEKSCRRVAEIIAAGKLEEQRSELMELLGDSIPKSLRFINASTEKMDSLLKGLLKLSRLGRMPLSIQPLDMNRMITEILSTLQFQIQSTKTTVSVAELPPCLGDPVQINQVITNLIDNAIKYRHPERPLVITVTGSIDGTQAVYHVTDNGIGIASEHAGKIWNIFHRLDPSSTPGEGLGLSIVKRIVDRHGGSIRLESTPGVGSTFILSLPCEPFPKGAARERTEA